MDITTDFWQTDELGRHRTRYEALMDDIGELAVTETIAPDSGQLAVTEIIVPLIQAIRSDIRESFSKKAVLELIEEYTGVNAL